MINGDEWRAAVRNPLWWALVAFCACSLAYLVFLWSTKP